MTGAPPVPGRRSQAGQIVLLVVALLAGLAAIGAGVVGILFLIGE